MNSNDHMLWSTQPMANDSDPIAEDFVDFLNFGDIPLSFDTPSHPHQHGIDEHDPNAMETDFTGAPVLRVPTTSRMSAQLGNLVSSVDIINMNFHQSLQQQLHLNEAQMQAHLQQQQQQQQQQRRQSQHQFHMNKMIPPTPSSMEIQGGDVTPQMYHNYYGLKDDQMVFTPLVSPAVTPLDTHFTHLPEYSLGSYFSPLTSPALEAQKHGSFPYISASSNNSNASKASSPIEPSGSPIMNKKLPSTAGRRKSVASSRNTARVVRQSPSMKPQRRKTPSALAQAPELAQSLAQQAQINTPKQQGLNSTSAQDMDLMGIDRESSSESISPEPMPELLMAPPPPPAVKGPILSLQQQQQQKPVQPMGPPPRVQPATPASLMKLPKSSIPTDTTQMPSAEASLMMLDSAHPIGLGQLNTNSQSRRGSYASSDEQMTPILHPNNQNTSKTPCSTAAQTTNSVPTSTEPSRNTSPVAKPGPQIAKQPSTLSTPRLTPKLQPINSSSRKRSIPASPALVPKISPNIKPLLSSSLLLDSSSSLQTAASILLASKSNYQNIVEGNSSSLGLTYPEELSTGLTSKRTSHKIAEQGRRNRINTALKEMASLLPPISGNSGADKSDGGDEGGAKEGWKKEGAQNTSKAFTVERAIEYIRALKGELEETKAKLRIAERKLNEQKAADENNVETSAGTEAAKKATKETASVKRAETSTASTAFVEQKELEMAKKAKAEEEEEKEHRAEVVMLD